MPFQIGDFSQIAENFQIIQIAIDLARLGSKITLLKAELTQVLTTELLNKKVLAKKAFPAETV